MPEFPGGEEAMNRYIVKNIKYPLLAQENGIQGRVICQFVVNADGKIVDVQVVRGVEASLDKEAKRVIESMPSWTPGRQGGKNVRVKYTLPIRFKL
jgi:protein TonB